MVFYFLYNKPLDVKPNLLVLKGEMQSFCKIL